MAVLIKRGVYGDLVLPAQKAFGRVASVYSSYGQDIVITSIRDGNHGNKSIHPIGHAFDIRYGDDIPENKIIEATGPDCDVIFHKTHIHIEYDPKR